MPGNDNAKADLRRAMKALLAGVPVATLAAASAAACRRLIDSVWFARAKVVMLYCPTTGEFDTGDIARECERTGRTVCLPRMDWTTRTLTPTRVARWGQGLVPGRHGIMEPAPGAPAVKTSSIDLVVVPGLAFDPVGWRLGRGAGVYDRFLAAAHPRAAKVGVALDEQIVDRVPTDNLDAPLDAVITPTRTLVR